MIRSYRKFKESEIETLQITGRTGAQISARNTELDKATKKLAIDKEDLLRVLSFLRLKYGCFHDRLELI